MAKHSTAWVFLDLETTGLKPDRDKIMEIGLIRYSEEGERIAWQQLVNPARALDPFISRLTGISDEMLADAPALAMIKDEAAELLADATIVAHSAAFDVSFLEQQLGIKPEQLYVIDTIEMAKVLYPGLRSYSLRSLTRTFQLPILPGHRALEDALALEQLFLLLAAKAASLPASVLEQVLMAFGGQERGMVSFFTELLMGRQPAWLADALKSRQNQGLNLEKTTAVAGLDSEGHWEQEAEEQRSVFSLESANEDSAAIAKREREEQALAREFWAQGHMAKILSPGGALAGQKENFQYRPGQVEMLEAVARAFASSRHLMAEAPTGIGKSLAYLIPALCWAKATGQRVVVATHTIALQEQLFAKDVTLLKEVLPFPFRSALLKGRGNYLCLNRFRQVLNQGKDLIWGERVLLARLTLWLAEGARGDQDDIHLLGPEREWFAQMASSRETCQGNQCPHYRQCFYQRAKQEGAAAQLVIVNHALLLAGARLGEGVIPKAAFLIIDEAHHLEEEGTKQFTDVFSLLEYEKKLQQLHKRRDVFGRPGFLQYLKEYRQQGFAALEAIEPYLEQMEKQIKAVMRRINSLQGILQNSTLPEVFRIKPGNPRGSNLQGLLTDLDNLLIMAGELKETIINLGRLLEGDEGKKFEETWLKQQLMLFEGVCGETELLERFLAGVEQRIIRKEPAINRKVINQELTVNNIEAEASVYWIQRELRQNDISLCLTPLNTASCFQQYLFNEKESVILTSATLSVNGGFEYCRQQLGIDPELLDTKLLSSPFNYAQQVLLLSDKDLPDPSKTADSAYNLALARSLEVLLSACGGRSMVLFTSHKQLRAMYEALQQPLLLMGLELFADGLNGSRSTLLEELRTNEKAVVFGANTFWEGVDLPGLFLTSLLIVRLPFTPPGQPLIEARTENLEKEGKDPFYHYSLPQAVLRFKQGYGRLIRTAEDWGVVVILDNRVINKRYGQIFLRSLPDSRCFGGSPKLLAEKIKEWKNRFLQTGKK